MISDYCHALRGPPATPSCIRAVCQPALTSPARLIQRTRGTERAFSIRLGRNSPSRRMISAPGENEQLVDSEKLSAWANSPGPSLQTLKFWMAQINTPRDFEAASNSQPCNRDIIMPSGFRVVSLTFIQLGIFLRNQHGTSGRSKDFFLRQNHVSLLPFLSSPATLGYFLCKAVWRHTKHSHCKWNSTHRKPSERALKNSVNKVCFCRKKHPATARATPLRPSSHAGLRLSSAWRETSKQFFHWRFHVLQRITDSGQSDDDCCAEGTPASKACL